MKQLLEILNAINPGIDYETEKRLIDDGLLDSFSILSLIPELEDAFDIEITPADMVPENFNSATALWSMINRLQEG
ncbi:acyl carrier protein [Lacrimispora sp.]|uniref:acyl carrier protein n=1 Tax=Lacrimispora sp. TaxID=2719234 RepID=UPI0039913D02